MKIANLRMDWVTGAVLLWLAFPPLAQAFYNPSTGKWLSRDPIGERGGLNVFGFIENDVINGVDYLGLKTKVKKCNITIFFGHNNTVPQDTIENEGCSAAGVVSCGPTEKWNPAIPGVPIEGTGNGRNNAGSLTIDQGITLVNGWIKKALAHAAKICKQNCCKRVTISVDCEFGWDLLGRAAATPPCGKTIVWDCATGKEVK